MTEALIDEYLRHRVGTEELAESSASVIRVVLRHWARHAPPAPRDWTTDHVIAWVRHGDPRANTRKSRLTKLRPFCRWLIAHGHMESDPTAPMGTIRIPDGAPRDLTVDEVRAVYAAAPGRREKLIVLLMAHMGLRCGDVARIRLEDIDHRHRRIHVRAKGGRGLPTHWEPVPTEAWDELDRYLRAGPRRSGPLLRSTWTGAALSPAWVGRLVVEAMYAAGVKRWPGDGISAHSLRHSCAQHLVDAGTDLRVVQAALAHRTIRSTELYVRREPPGLREAMEGRSYRSAA